LIVNSNITGAVY